MDKNKFDRRNFVRMGGAGFSINDADFNDKCTERRQEQILALEKYKNSS